ncbi:thiolase family protein [Mycolicibacterium goodii]|uniref:thiolase family protein n=1 Tax=Mycolicibacterium goodii TaxID=134601 RepID=UPI001BDD8AF4|nr:thiolase family protein [Mycolicibacterium goodii]MBU8808192.1 thiolase family protein [Mycolicibacterium goodii]
MRNVYIAGAGRLPFKSKYPMNYQELALEAAKLALGDAQAGKADVDSVVYSIYNDLLLRQGTPDVMLHEYLGFSGKPAQRVTQGAATGGYAFKAAYADIASGLSDVCLLIAVQKALDVTEQSAGQRGDAALTAENWTLDATWDMPFAQQPWALILNRYIARYGEPTPDDLAAIAVKNRGNAVLNEFAQLRTPVTLDEVLNARLVGAPTTMYESCLYSETAAAVLLISDKARASLPRRLRVAGVGTCHADGVAWTKDSSDPGIPSVGGSVSRAYAMAGITDPTTQVDLFEVHDLTTGVELITYEELGLAPRGAATKLLRSGQTQRDGATPVNVSGGRIAAGHIAGASAVFSISEVTDQLLGRAGAHQIPTPKGVGVVSSTGGAGLSLGAAAVLTR